MISILNLVTLFLRLSLFIQGQVAVVSDYAVADQNLSCHHHSKQEQTLQTDSDWFSGNVTLARKLEKEERIEVEGEVSFGISCSCFPKPLELAYGLDSHPTYGTKAIRGSLLPLYDFYQSWKIHLS